MLLSKCEVCDSKKSKFIKQKDNLDLHIVLVGHLQKTKKEYNNLRKKEIQDLFINTNLT